MGTSHSSPAENIWKAANSNRPVELAVSCLTVWRRSCVCVRLYHRDFPLCFRLSPLFKEIPAPKPPGVVAAEAHCQSPVKPQWVEQERT
eukprot:1154845-Pelagomonas_calceolata.AAC.2